MDVLTQDLRFAIRSLRRTPGFTIVVVAVMALGIGVNAMMLTMVYGVLFRPWPLPHFDQVVTVLETNRAQEMSADNVSWLNYQAIRDRVRSFRGVGGYWASDGQVTIGEDAEPAHLANITAGLLPVLGIAPQLGRNITADEEVAGRNWTSVLISDRVWRARFGGRRDVLGRTLRLNGRVRTITGVLPAGFHWPEYADYWIPAAMSADESRHHSDHQVELIARLAVGATRQQANAEIAVLYSQLRREAPAELAGWSGRVNGYLAEYRKSFVPLLLVMSIAVAFVLLIACANVANLVLARAASRRREIGVRLALGATRGRLVRQQLTESIALALLGAGLGVALSTAGNRLWIGMIPVELPFWLRFQVDGPVLLGTLAESLCAAFAFGLLPALHVSDTGLAEATRDGGAQSGAGRERARARSSLVVAEVALSLALLVASGLMVRSLFAMLDSEKLVRADGVYTARFMLPVATWASDSSRREFGDRVLAAAGRLPGVVTAALVNDLPLGESGGGPRVYTENGARNDRQHGERANFVVCSPGYFATLGLPLRTGRDFAAADGPGARAVAIVNESLARALWPGSDPLGRRLDTVDDHRGLGWRTVVGVVRDVPQSLDDDHRIAGSIFLPYRQAPDQTMTWVIRVRGAPAAFADIMRAFMRAQAPDVPLTDVRSMHEAVRFAVWNSRLFGSLMAFFAALALVIAAVGLYGVMAYSVAQRTREIGIRIALGAQRLDVVRLVMRQALRLTLIGAGIGCVAAYALGRLLAHQLFQVSPTDPSTWIGMALLLAFCSILAAWVPARRAARVDPMRALRSE